MMAAGHPPLLRGDREAWLPDRLDEQGPQRTSTTRAPRTLMIYTPCQKGFVYETPRALRFHSRWR